MSTPNRFIALMISLSSPLFGFRHHRGLRWRRSRAGIVSSICLFCWRSYTAGDERLYGSYRLDGVVAVIYGVHLTTIAALNALLWILALRGRYDPQLLATALVPVIVFVIGTTTAFVAPKAAQFIWCLAFLAPLGGWLAARRAG